MPQEGLQEIRCGCRSYTPADRYPVLAADVEKYKEAHRERILAKAETHDTGSLARLLLPGGALSTPVPVLEQALLLRGPPAPKERQRPPGCPRVTLRAHRSSGARSADSQSACLVRPLGQASGRPPASRLPRLALQHRRRSRRSRSLCWRTPRRRQVAPGSVRMDLRLSEQRCSPGRNFGCPWSCAAVRAALQT